MLVQRETRRYGNLELRTPTFNHAVWAEAVPGHDDAVHYLDNSATHRHTAQTFCATLKKVRAWNTAHHCHLNARQGTTKSMRAVLKPCTKNFVCSHKL